MQKVLFLVFAAAVVLGLSMCDLHATEPIIAYSLIEQVGPSTVAAAGERAMIQAFDLLSDDNRLVMLYDTGEVHSGIWANDQLRIGLWDISTHKFISRTMLAEDSLPPPTHSSDPKGPLFNESYLYSLRLRRDLAISGDQNYLIAMGLGRVWILDAKTCSIIRSIGPPDVARAAPVRIHAVSNSFVAVVYEYDYQRFQVDVIELRSGDRIAEWRSSAIPQSFSPDGELAVADDLNVRNSGGVTNVQVLDTRTGTKLKSIPVGFHFKKNWLGELSTNGGVAVQFLNNQQVVVIPDASRGRDGHRSGNSVEFVDIAQGRITREIKPDHFGPTGVLIVSADRRHFALESAYATPPRIAMESTDPKDYRHSIMVFDSQSGTKKADIVYSLSKSQNDLPVGGRYTPLRSSADALTLAIAVSGEVQIYRAK